MGNNRLQSRPASFPRGAQPQQTQNLPIEVTKVDGGMNTFVDPADIEDNELTVAQNVFIRNNKVTRRFGESTLTPAKPNSSPIKKMYTAKQSDGTIIQLRFAGNTIYRRGSGSWTQIVPDSIALVAPANNVVSTDNRHFFSNNGSQVIQEINLATNEYLALGNAPQYKYITSFFNRIVGANLQTPGSEIPIQVGWSGDFDFSEWNPAVNLSAGFAPLEESQSDYADAITGLFGFANQMIVLREQSIWLANKIPGTNPFFFFTAVPSIGCDTPDSVQKIPGGIAFYDRRTKNVYSFKLGEGLKEIGEKVRDSIFSAISDPTLVFSGYDPVEDEYILCTPLQSTNTIRGWVYNFKTSVWSYNDYESITSIDTVNFEDASVLIQDLTGNIEDLIGNIQDLGPNSVPTPVLWFGRNDGDIKIQQQSNNSGYTTIITSKTWTGALNYYFQRLEFTYEVLSDGGFSIEYSKDNQQTWKPYKSVTFSSADYGKRLLVACVKTVYSRQFSWRIVSSSGIFSVIDFKMTVTPGGFAR